MSKKVFLLLTLLAGLVLGWSHVHYINVLSQGDHGRDLYAFEQVYRGKMIYKDIWWVYGPLMPYYYGLFYLILGFKISSVLFGKLLLVMLSGAFFYLASCVVMRASWAFLATIFFLQMQQDFFFTLNHIGAIALSLGVFWLLLEYIYQPKLKTGILAVGFAFLIGLIKINFGLTALVVTLLSIAFIDYLNTKKFLPAEHKNFYVTGFILVPALWFLIYSVLLGGLHDYEIHQCMPYFGDDQPHHRSPFETIPFFLMQHWLTLTHAWGNLQNIVNAVIHQPSVLLTPTPLLMTSIVLLNFLTHPIIHISMFAALILSFPARFAGPQRNFWLVLFVLWSFFILNFHEFIVSGVWYRTFWSQPFLLFFNFFMIATAVSLAPVWVRRMVGGIFVIFLALISISGFNSYKTSNTPNKLLTMPRGGVYVGNEPAWVDTVNHVTDYLNKTLQKDELFFALPYDCIYYYTTGKPSPTRQLIFFDHIKIPPLQEATVIQELQQHNVNYILMSNRVAASEPGLGIFGKTYCPLLAQYIGENFAPVYRYGGNWQAEPEWGGNHGVIIFKRK